ncbi:MAG: AraC family transcriptional regulator [Dyadobacter fermentans]
MANLINRSEPGRSILHFQELGIDDAFMLGKYSYLGTRTKLDEHVHEDIIEIVYCDSGQQIYQVHNEQFLIRGGDVFVTFPNEPHSTADHPEEKGALYWLQIKIPKDKTSFLGHSHENAACLIDALTGLKRRHFKGSATIKTILDKIFGLCSQDISPYSKLAIAHQLTSVLLTVIEDSSDFRPNASDVLRVEKVLTYIEENLGNSFSVSKLADHHHISESHFKRWFKKEVGVAPMDYIQRRKIERAKSELANNWGMNITDIAFQLNFSSAQYFSTVFKKYVGTTPFEYRCKFL